MIVDVKACPVPAQDLHVDSIEIISCFQDKLCSCFIIGASLSKPHIDHDNGPLARNNGIYPCIFLCMYVCIYLSIYLSMSVSFTTCLSHPSP